MTDGAGFWPEVEAPKTDELVLRDFSAKRDVRGNGFYINNTDVLTALHTVENCKNPQFDAKTPAQVIATDKARGLALLTSTNRSTAWLPISRAFPNKGEPIHFLSFQSAGTGSLALGIAGSYLAPIVVVFGLLRVGTKGSAVFVPDLSQW